MRVEGLGFRVHDLVSQGFGFRVQGLQVGEEGFDRRGLLSTRLRRKLPDLVPQTQDVDLRIACRGAHLFKYLLSSDLEHD